MPRSKSVKNDRRVRSKSTRRSASVGKRKTVRFANAVAPRFDANAFISKIRSIRQMKMGLERKALAVKEGWYDAKDKKEVSSGDTSLIDSLTRELALLKGVFRGGVGDRPIKMRLSTPFSLVSTVTTGIVNIVNVGSSGASNALDPTQCSEWSTLTSLFDEYKMLGGEVVFAYFDATPVLTTPSAANAANYMPVIAYDADAVSSASNSIALTQQSQHKILINSAGSAYVCSGNHRFPFHIPRGTVVGGTIGALPGTEWIAVAGASSAGSILFYHVGSVVTASQVGVGVVYFDFEFRCRN